MDHFQPKGGELYAEDVPLREIAERFGTPTYVYSRATLTRHVQVLGEALSAVPYHLCYAVKANGNQAILSILKELGCGFDAVSLGELHRVLKTGVDPKHVLVSGVGKSDEEIEAALSAGALYICVESEEELEAIARLAAQRKQRAPVSIRVNPDIDAKTHPYIATGFAKNKFGIPWTRARELYVEHRDHPHLHWVGVTCHIGSQITDLTPFAAAAELMAGLARDLLDQGLPLQYLGLGGGLGIPYRDEDAPPSPRQYGETLRDALAGLPLTLVLEPGRVLVGNAGVLLTKVVRQKQGASRAFVLVDAGMNDLIRPALYQAHHAVVPVCPRTGPTGAVDVVGPVCESADTFLSGVILPPLETSDLLALRSAGAYGFVMASTYNGRPRAAEVLVDGSRAFLIRQRESFADLWRGELGLDGAPIDDHLML